MTTMCMVQKSTDWLRTFINHTTIVLRLQYGSTLYVLHLTVHSVASAITQFAGGSKKYFGTYHAELIIKLDPAWELSSVPMPEFQWPEFRRP